MSNCAKCGKPTDAPGLRRAAGPVTWCIKCWLRPNDHGWDALTVNSNTHWEGGRVVGDPHGDRVDDENNH